MFFIHEAVSNDFIKSHGNHGIFYIIYNLLFFGSLPFGHLSHRKCCRNFIVAIETGNFFDQINFPFNIHTVMRYGNADTAINGSMSKCQAVHHRYHSIIGDIYANGFSGMVKNQIHFSFLKFTVKRIQRTIHQGATGQLAKKLANTLRSTFGGFNIDPFFKAGSSFRSQTEFTRGKTNGFRVEISTLDQNILRFGSDFRILTTHHTGNPNGLFTVADQEHIRIEIPFLIV